MKDLQFYQLKSEEKYEIFSKIAEITNLPLVAVEKDWWVVQTLRLVFELDCAESLVFKGGTSLSKAWGLIERFSEDIDLALDRRYLGFENELTITQIKKLRKASFAYISEILYPSLKANFEAAGLSDVEIKLQETTVSDKDPLIIEIFYPSVLNHSDYLKPKILIEVGSRSLREPFSIREFGSLIDEYYPNRHFSDKFIQIPTVNPERTFLEKIFLLHEEFQKPTEKIRVERLSRHLYDIERLANTEYADKALNDKKLYDDIVSHRKLFTPIRGIDYANHTPSAINPIPPQSVIKYWEEDYLMMQKNMIYGTNLPFKKLIEKIAELKQKINELK